MKLNTKRVKTLAKLAEPHGYQFDKVTGKGHLRFVGPGGVVFASGTASCKRADKNFVRDIKRAASAA